MLMVYVLELENNKFYVGSTVNINLRIEQHKNGTACKWTKIHKFLRLKVTYHHCDIFEEDKITKTLMNEYGIMNVRGGSYVQIELPLSQIDSLRRELDFANGRCLYCKDVDHFINNCPLLNFNKTNINSSVNTEIDHIEDNGSKDNRIKSDNTTANYKKPKKCTHPDHNWWVCPETRCMGCGNYGHIFRMCQNPKCYNCLGFGHLSYNCPKPSIT